MRGRVVNYIEALYKYELIGYWDMIDMHHVMSKRYV